MSLITDQVMSKLKPEEQEAVRMILKEYSKDGKSDLLQKLYDEDYEEIPVDIDTFIESPEYAGWFTDNGKGVYPYWRDKLREMYNEDKNYSEIAVTGGIGTGKTHIAVLALSYGLYRVMCLKDPVRYYRLNGDILYVVFFNATLQLSRGVAYSKFQELLQHSPWFMARGKVTGTKYLEYTPNGPIRFTVGSQYEHSLGRAVILGLMDEVNFTKGADVDFEKSRIMAVYASILERIGSRFTINGKVRGKLFLVSSKKTEYDFIESYIRKQMGKPGIYVVDSKIWEVKPEGTYCGETFKLAVGTSNLPSKIIPPTDDPDAYVQQGYDIMDIPIEFIGRFEINMEAALMNVAGVSVSNVTKFMAYPNIEQCIIPQKNPFRANILTIGTKDNLKYQDFFEPELVPPEVYSKPLFIHFDCSLTGDKTGIGCVAVLGYTNRNGYDEFTGEHVEFRELAYRQVFTVGIQCPNGAEISFRKDREFIYYLKHELGWNIKGISLDSFQSADLKQSFITAGFTDTSIVSLDKKPDGYLSFRTAINERRIQILENQPELIKELVELKQDNQTGKVDHPIDGCFTAETKVSLVDGRELSIAELLIEQQYKDNYVYTFNETLKIIEPKKIKKVFQTKITSDLLRVTLDTGEVVECTPNHKFMLRDGSYKCAEDLQPMESLMPLYRKPGGGNLKAYRTYYEPMEEEWHFEHRRFCYNVNTSRGYVVHHCNFIKSDNRPSNLICITKSKHNMIHNNQTKDYSIVSEKVAAWHKRSKDDPNYIAMHKKHGETWRLKNKEITDKKKYLYEEHVKRVNETFGIDYKSLSANEKDSYSIRLKLLEDPKFKASRKSYKPETHKNLHEIHHSKTWITNGVDNKYVNKTDVIPDGWHLGRTLSKEARQKMSITRKANREQYSERLRKQSLGRVWVNNGSENNFVTKEQLAALDPNVWKSGRLTPWHNKEYKNHKVVKIERIHKPCRVYDLEIEDNHNFALSAGIFVHNSKDLGDSFAGALYNASLHDGQFAFELVDNAMLFGEVNEPDQDEKINLVNGLLSSPANSVMNRYGNKDPNVNNPEVEAKIREAADMYNGFLSW